MSAERLREAATTLRAVANDATRGRWIVDPYTSLDHSGWCVEPEDGPGDVSPIDCTHAEDAYYIAAMQPAVALALADWLDQEARKHESRVLSMASQRLFDQYEDLDDEAPEQPTAEHHESAKRIVAQVWPIPHALAVADAILGEA